MIQEFQKMHTKILGLESSEKPGQLFEPNDFQTLDGRQCMTVICEEAGAMRMHKHCLERISGHSTEKGNIGGTQQYSLIEKDGVGIPRRLVKLEFTEWNIGEESYTENAGVLQNSVKGLQMYTDQWMHIRELHEARGRLSKKIKREQSLEITRIGNGALSHQAGIEHLIISGALNKVLRRVLSLSCGALD